MSESNEAPLFVLATRLYVRYRFKTHKTIDPQFMLVSDDYARAVLKQVREAKDATLDELAARFEAARFAAAGVKPEPAPDEPMLDLSLDSPA